MPFQGQEFDLSGYATVSGWGTLTSGGEIPDTLNYVDVPLVKDEGKLFGWRKMLMHFANNNKVLHRVLHN